MKHLDLFSGIGGFALAAERVWPNIEHEFCEVDPFCQKVLKKHWPNSRVYGDIKKFDGTKIGPIDLLTGGFPCQPFSAAGNRRGTEDDRHLWPEMLRIIRECRPRWVLAENVAGLITWNGGMVLEGVLSDLEAASYETLPPLVIPAVAVEAPHRRDRVWIIAHAIGDGVSGGAPGRHARSSKKKGVQKRDEVERVGEPNQIRTSSDSHSVGREGRLGRSNTKGQGGPKAFHDRLFKKAWPEIAALLCTVDDGLPDGLVRPRGWRNAALKGAGNSIVPQVAEEIFKAIKLIKDELH